MRLPLLLVALSAMPLAAFALDAGTGSLQQARERPRPVGLCVRTARDGYVVLQARLMQSSGNSKTDAAALKNVIGSSVPTPNQRMWFEWLPMQIDYDARNGGGSEAPMPDCSVLDREARIKARVR